MTFELPALPYDMDALAPHISKETLEYHYGKHHRAYVSNLNALTKDTPWADKTLEEIVKQADGKVFNNAAQAWNHAFYWQSLSPASNAPNAELSALIDQSFGSFEQFKDAFSTAAATLFGSGWTWLVKNTDGTLEIITTPNAGNPMTDNKTPLLTCDVWEHAYYIDYRNARPQYIEHFWSLVNWDFVADNLAK
jgi:superoxide dismutase, Fe-Mn family